MDDKDRYLELFSAYESGKYLGNTSLLDYCHRFGVDYYKYLSWYRTYKRQFSADSCGTNVEFAPVHVTRLPSKKSGRRRSASDEPSSSDVLSFRLKLRNGIEISQHDTTLDSIASLLGKLGGVC